MSFHKQKQNVKIITFYRVLTPAPRDPTLKQKTCHIKRVIISNCTKFLKHTREILLIEIIQNTSSTTRLFTFSDSSSMSSVYELSCQTSYVNTSPLPAIMYRGIYTNIENFIFTLGNQYTYYCFRVPWTAVICLQCKLAE